MDATPDSMHRLVKVLADTGEALTLAEANEKFAAYGVVVSVGADVIGNPTLEMMLLTVLNCAARSFRGNVYVRGDLGSAFMIPGHEGQSLGQFLVWAGVVPYSEAPGPWPIIAIGNASGQIRPWTDGWRFGIGRPGAVKTGTPTAAVAAAGLAVSEAFSILRGDNTYAGRRTVSANLWHPGTVAAGPDMSPPLPSLWVVGLGHLGQAYAWTMRWMAWLPASELFLQDVDVITESTLSTSLLSTKFDIGKRKTRVVASFFDRQFAKTAIVERRFDSNQRVGLAEPRTALFGVDNAAARRSIEQAGFGLVIDTGLGAGYQNFRGIRVRSFPGPSTAAELWATGDEADQVVITPAYENLLRQGSDACGVTQLASRSVGAPFVGCVAAAFALTQIQRAQIQGHALALIDCDVRDLNRIDSL